MLATSDDEQAAVYALFCCKYGKNLSGLEDILAMFYTFHWRWEVKRNRKADSGLLAAMNYAEEIKTAEDNYNHWKEMVSSIFIKFLIDHNRKGILELADAAAFFKDKIGPNAIPADPIRGKLLGLKG